MIKRMRSRAAYSSRAPWQNLSAPSSFEKTRLNGNDLDQSISLELLIEDEEPNATDTPKFCLFIRMFLGRKYILGCFK